MQNELTIPAGIDWIRNSNHTERHRILCEEFQVQIKGEWENHVGVARENDEQMRPQVVVIPRGGPTWFCPLNDITALRLPPRERVTTVADGRRVFPIGTRLVTTDRDGIIHNLKVIGHCDEEYCKVVEFETGLAVCPSMYRFDYCETPAMRSARLYRESLFRVAELTVARVRERAVGK